ncbi:MAG TPA: quinone-dependent dihydroorotate dehydrogenase [Polyangiaceae bacterium]|nr:quinone-dependent dihydroorotate dehydrogenase [Polyangiaceae bacterium]
MYTWALRPLLFLLPPDVAHAVAFAGMAPLEYLPPLRALARALAAPHDPRIAVQAMGLTFPSPLGLAGGFDKNGVRPRALAALGFGHLELGTVTALAQEANPPPNMFRLPRDRALVNRLGFPNQGAARLGRRIAARHVVRGGAGVPVGVSIGKSRAVPIDDLERVIADYVAAFTPPRVAGADFVVVNVSSPNTKDLRAMQAAPLARALLAALAKANADVALGRGGAEVPLLLKIAPDLDDAAIEALLAVVEEVGLSGVVATNTTVARTGLATDAARVEAIGAGGLSGAPLRARALDVVKRVRARLGPKAAVVGVGGVENAEHAMALVRAGADLVQMYTGFIYEGPGTPARIARELAAMVTREGAATLRELRG